MLRDNWVQLLERIAWPVLDALSRQQLRRTLPVEHHAKATTSHLVTHLEAFGRTLAGLAPWLELDPSLLSDDERLRQARMRETTHAALVAAVDPASADYLNFTVGRQPLVDTAFLSHAILRAPRFFSAMSASTRQNLIAAMISTRPCKPGFSNWLLFSAMIEAALFHLRGDFDPMRVDYAVRQHDAWYLGDGVYSDGPDYHGDYYNSYVIQPMLVDVLRTVGDQDRLWTELLPKVLERARRHTEFMERLVAPDGSFPAVGRSIAYRCGAFQLPAQMALQHELPQAIAPAQMRGALWATIDRTMNAPGTFDEQGFLRIGLSGHQPSLGESYISTGSLYLCTTAFLPLGLGPQDPFWSGDQVPYTSQRIWAGEDIPAYSRLYPQ